MCVCVCVCTHTCILFQMFFYHNIWLWFRKNWVTDILWKNILTLCVSVVQLCPTLCDPVDCSPPGSSMHGILQARILEWVAMPSSRGSSPPKDQTSVSHIEGRFFTTEPQGSLCRLQLLGARKVGGSWWVKLPYFLFWKWQKVPHPVWL